MPKRPCTSWTVALALLASSCVSYEDLRGADRDVFMPVVEGRYMWNGQPNGWFVQGKLAGGRGEFDEELLAGEQISLGDATLSGPDEIEVDVEIRDAQLAFGRRVAGERLEFAWYLGFDWIAVDYEFDGANAANDQDELRRSRNFLVGIWFAGHLDERWALEFGHAQSVPTQGDAIFTSTWDLLLSWRACEYGRLFAGWRSIEVYEDDKSEVEIELSGPAFGLAAGI
jgi:hypothetical protein